MKYKNLNASSLEIAKEISNEIWDNYSDEFGYRSDKQTRNNEVSVERPDNIWFFWGQFDSKNKLLFLTKAVFASERKGGKDLLEWAKIAWGEEFEAIKSLRKKGIEF